MSRAIRPSAELVAALPGAGPAKQEFYGALESLRGLAAFLVVLYHLPPWFGRVYNIALIRHGLLMVDFFFVLSGFVLYHSYADRVRTGGSLARFLALRVGRLYPVHLAFMVPFVAIELVRYLAFRRYGVSDMNASPSLGNLGRSVVANVLLVHGLGFTANTPNLNFPSWSISTEFYAYLVFGAGLLWLGRRWFLAYAGVIFTVCIALLVAFRTDIGDVGGFLRCVAGFFFGCGVCAAYKQVRGRTLTWDWPLLIMSVIAVALALPWVPAAGQTWWSPIGFPLAGGLIVTLLLAPRSLLNRLLLTRPLRWLGKISYSLYMAHALVQWGARQVCRAIFKGPEIIVDGVSATLLKPGAAGLAYVLVTLATLGLAWLSFVLVEHPSRDLARRLVSRWSAVRAVSLRLTAHAPDQG